MSRNTKSKLHLESPSKIGKGDIRKKRKFSKRIHVKTFEALNALAIKENLSEIDKGKLFKAVTSIIRQDGNGLSFSEISRNYWRPRLGGNYCDTLRLLEKEGLIAIDHFYLNLESKEKNVCKKFKLTFKVLRSPLLKVAVKYTYNLPETHLEKVTFRIVKELKLDRSAALL